MYMFLKPGVALFIIGIPAHRWSSAGNPLRTNSPPQKKPYEMLRMYER